MPRLAVHACLLAAALGLAACAAGPGPERVSPLVHPTLWRVLRADGSEAYYLLGSVHVGRGAPPRFPAAVTKAFDRASALVLELDPLSEVSARERERLTQRYAVIRPPESLRDRVSSRVLVELDAYLQNRNEPLAPYLEFEPWALVELLADEAKRERGLDPAYGVDRTFAARARRRDKPIVELESAEAQMRVLYELPQSIHEVRLHEALLRPAQLGARAEALLEAWERGDQATLERQHFAPLRESPELRVFYERVIYRRNERMARRLAELARDGRLRFAVIGAGHLVGPRGIPALLHEQGFRVQRKQR